MSSGQGAPVSRDEDDRYGFTAVADGLARSVLALDGDEGTVIGIEGRWGAGKTSLLNLLLTRLENRRLPGTHVIRFSPWLNGAGGSLAEVLLLPVAEIIQQEEMRRDEEQPGLKKRTMRWFKQLGQSRNAGTALDVLKYVQQTSGRLAPVADFAGNFVPGFTLASKGMDALAKIDLSAGGKTAADLHRDIESKLKTLGLTFIVVIDDLDRLEPAQAVEVLRLVRSVADFSRFRYVMCYDRDVLAHAVQQGLGVLDGRLYLQKIVPLSFGLPRPETFTLSRHLRDEAVSLYRKVNGRDPDADLLQELESVANVYGEALSTPREVSQALSAIRFRYDGLKDYVWFPDLCLLQLLRVANPALYDWAEHYLSERAVVATGDGALAEEEEKHISASLSKALLQFPTHAARSPWELGKWVPGIEGRADEGAVAFQQVDARQEDAATVRRRLASTVYWRYYFSFSAPGNVLSEEEIQDILRLASNDTAGLSRRLLESVTDNGVSSRTWLEHILTRLTPAVTRRAEPDARSGLLEFVFTHADEVMQYYRHGGLFRYQKVGLDELATQLIGQMLEDQRAETLAYLQMLIGSHATGRWSASYFRSVLWLHGVVGSRPGFESDRFLSADELDVLRRKVAERMAPPELKSADAELDAAGSYLWAWRDIAGEETVKLWVEKECREDAAFLRLLLSLRSHVTSSNRGRYLTLEIDRAEKLTGQTGQFQARLDEIAARNEPALTELLGRVQEAVKEAQNW
ncbi:P-loop NTPase fold protein [Pantoea agglomerans]|uniref:KAP family P-loop NTPase fold protein n=1 Tax=Pantoea TaxID=53335 RepID=UPI0032082A6B